MISYKQKEYSAAGAEFSAMVRVGHFNRWLLLLLLVLLPGFRIPELNWSLPHCALLSTGASRGIVATLHSALNWSHHKMHVQFLVALCKNLSGAVQCRESVAAIYLPLFDAVTTV